VSDLWIGTDSFETDVYTTTRTSWVGSIVAGIAVVASFVSLFMGIDPAFYFATDGVANVSGDRMWNTFGWVLGAVATPLIVVIAHQFELRRALSPDHIRVSSRNRLLGVILIAGLVISTIHAFLGSASIKFGS